MTTAATPLYPFVKHIDSSVVYADGIWFSSGKWTIRISRDTKTILMPCAVFKTPGYWEPLPNAFLDRMDSCAYPPAMGIIVGFWIFNGTQWCLRVPEMRDKISEGPGEIKDLWPKTAGTPYADQLAACVNLEASIDSTTYVFLSKADSPEEQQTAIYIRRLQKPDHEIGASQSLYERYPRLRGHIDLHSGLRDSPVTSMLRFEEGMWFFFDSSTGPECHVFKYSDLDQSGDLGPGPISTYFPALATAACHDS
jgi:hypothetical protein